MVKMNKSTGPDRVLIEMLSAIGDFSFDEITEIINYISVAKYRKSLVKPCLRSEVQMNTNFNRQ